MDAGIELWLFDAGAAGDAALGRLAATLGDQERRRCAAFLRPQRRRQFIAGRALARKALGELLGLAPDIIRLDQAPGQGPRLVHPSLTAYLSISHSGPWVACAVGAAALGLDIEVIDPDRDVLALAEQAFEPAQAAQLARLPQAERVQRFYAMWCALEAAIKLGREPLSTASPHHGQLVIAVASAMVRMGPLVPRTVTLDDLA